MSRFAPGTDLSIYEPDSLTGGRPVLKNQGQKDVGIGGGPGIPPRFPGGGRKRKSMEDRRRERRKRIEQDRREFEERRPRRPGRSKPPGRRPIEGGDKPFPGKPPWMGEKPPFFEGPLPGPGRRKPPWMGEKPPFFEGPLPGPRRPPEDKPRWGINPPKDEPRWGINPPQFPGESPSQDSVKSDFLKGNLDRYTQFLNLLRSFKVRR